jgi:outer membrane protein assembly factor BamD (BamD/ComL family)
LVPTRSAETLAAERSLLDEARSALRAGDASGALRDLDLHAQRFPAGILAEERDAMTVEALVAAGRADDARAAGARFRGAHPGSLLQPMVEDALKSIP